MRRQNKPNLQLLLRSTVSALQDTYSSYKKAVVEDLRCTWYSDDGEFTFLAGAEERKKKITDLAWEVIRLQTEVARIKEEMAIESEVIQHEWEGSGLDVH